MAVDRDTKKGPLLTVAELAPGARHAKFPHLFSPIRLGPITAKNRIVNSAHQPRFAHAGHYTEQLIAYHRERAQGGAAVIVSGATSVTPDYLDLKNVDGRIVDEYQQVMEAAMTAYTVFCSDASKMFA